MKKLRKYGWKRDKLNGTEKVREVPKRLSKANPLPPMVDLRAGMPPVYDQGELGSCTANALAAAFEYAAILQKKAVDTPSRLFIYWNERAIEGTVNEDSGAQIKDGITALSKWGVCSETIWPYNPKMFIRKPSVDAFNAAIKEVVSKYERVPQTELGLKSVLAKGLPVAFGFTVYAPLESADVAQSGIVPMPATGEEPMGGHAVLLCGYDDSKKLFLVRNSWGSTWGQGGYFQIPYAYLLDSELASDFWAIDFVP